jgi:hypothetical protein
MNNQSVRIFLSGISVGIIISIFVAHQYMLLTAGGIIVLIVAIMFAFSKKEKEG